MRRTLLALACLPLLANCFGSYAMDVAAADMIVGAMQSDPGDQPQEAKEQPANGEVPETLPEDPDCC